MQHRSEPLNDVRLVATALPSGSHLVRVHPREGVPYDRMIVVTEQDGGEALFLCGWIGGPPGGQWWRQAAQTMFPRAKVARFERRTNGRVRQLEVRLHQEAMQ